MLLTVPEPNSKINISDVHSEFHAQHEIFIFHKLSVSMVLDLQALESQ